MGRITDVVYVLRKRERARGARDYAANPNEFHRWESPDWRRGWRQAQQEALRKRPAPVITFSDPDAAEKIRYYAQIEYEKEQERFRDFMRNQLRMKAARRGGGNRSGTTGGRKLR